MLKQLVQRLNHDQPPPFKERVNKHQQAVSEQNHPPNNMQHISWLPPTITE